VEGAPTMERRALKCGHCRQRAGGTMKTQRVLRRGEMRREKKDTGQGPESVAKIGGRKAKTTKLSAEWVGGGGGRRVGTSVGSYKKRGEDPRGWLW